MLLFAWTEYNKLKDDSAMARQVPELKKEIEDRKEANRKQWERLNQIDMNIHRMTLDIERLKILAEKRL